MRVCSPENYDGCRDIESVEVFTVRHETQLKMHSGTHEPNMIEASCLLEGKAPKRWLQRCREVHLIYAISVQAFAQRLTDRILPRSAAEPTLGELRRPKQVKLPIECYIEENYSSVRRAIGRILSSCISGF